MKVRTKDTSGRWRVDCRAPERHWSNKHVPIASFSLRIKNSGDVEKAIARFKDRARPAIVRALNRSAVSARTVMVRDVAKDFGIRQKDVAISVENASPSTLTARVVAQGARLPLITFNARQTARGVSANTGRGRKVYPHTFIAKVHGPLPNGVVSPGHLGVFQRRGAQRLPIDQRYGASIPHVFEKHIDAGIARGQEQLVKNLKHEFEFALAQLTA
jgi:hypothetical protein